MSIFKPFLKTFILAAILFFIIVFLGMKYHWVERLQPDQLEQKEIHLPVVDRGGDVNGVGKIENIPLLSSSTGSNTENSANESDLQVITNVDYAEVVANMDKNEVQEVCTEIYEQSTQDPALKELAIGNCVVSNYSESVSVKTTGSNNNRQIQTQKKNATLACWKELQLGGSDYSPLEQQLLIGVCVADRLSRK